MFKKKGGASSLKVDGGLDFIKKKDIAEWTVVEVGLWLNAINLSQYSDAFFFNEIDGEMLADLDEDDLIAMPIERMGHRKKILRRVAKIKNPNSSSHKNSESDSASIDSEAKPSSVSASSSSSSNIRVKCLYHDEIRTVVFKSDETMESFNSKITEEFGSNQAAKYRDEDGDMVTIRNIEDLRSFLASAKSGKGKLTLFSTRKKKGKAKKSRKKERRAKSDTSGEDFDVLENFVDAVVVSDRKGTIQFFNGAAEDMFGYDREEMIGQNVRALMNQEDAKHHNQYLRRYRREGNSKIIGKGRKVMAKSKEGKLFEVWLSLSETDTSFTAIIQLIQGSRPQVAAAEPVKIRDLSAEFEAFTNYPTPIAVVDDDGFIQYANPALHSAFLFDSGTLLGLNISTISPAVSAESGEDLISDYIATLQGKKATLLTRNARDVICYTKKGTLIAKIAEFSHRQVDSSVYYVVEFKSQDAHKDQASSVLQAQRAVISSLIIPALIIDENAIVQEINPAAREIFGFSISEVLGRNVNIMIPPGELFDVHTSYVKNYAATGKGRGPNGTSSVVGKGREVIGQSKDGHQLRLLLSVTMATEKTGEKVFTGILQLLSKVEKAVIDSAVLKQQVEVIDQLIIPACVITQDSIVRAFNKAAQDIFGFSDKELIGRDVNNLIPLGEIHNIHGKLVQNFAEGKKNPAESVVIGKGRKVTGRHKDGHHVNVLLSVTERKDGNVVIFTGTFTAL
jgi:PAS domain S-box-containing protein